MGRIVMLGLSSFGNLAYNYTCVSNDILLAWGDCVSDGGWTGLEKKSSLSFGKQLSHFACPWPRLTRLS